SGDECPPEVLGAESSVVTTWRKLDIVHYAMEAPGDDHDPLTDPPFDQYYHCINRGDCRIIIEFNEAGEHFSIVGFLDDIYFAANITERLGKSHKHFLNYDFGIPPDPELGLWGYSKAKMDADGEDYDTTTVKAYIWGIDVIGAWDGTSLGLWADDPPQGFYDAIPMVFMASPYIKYRVDRANQQYEQYPEEWNTYPYSHLKTLSHELMHIMRPDLAHRPACPEEESVENDVLRPGLPRHDVLSGNDCPTLCPVWLSYDYCGKCRQPISPRFR
ncbi:MAG: hypothetical protein HRF49_03895, partial [bacterium]